MLFPQLLTPFYVGTSSFRYQHLGHIITVIYPNVFVGSYVDKNMNSLLALLSEVNGMD